MVMTAFIRNAAFMISGRFVMLLDEFPGMGESTAGQNEGNRGQTIS